MYVLFAILIGFGSDFYFLTKFMDWSFHNWNASTWYAVGFFTFLAVWLYGSFVLGFWLQQTIGKPFSENDMKEMTKSAYLVAGFSVMATNPALGFMYLNMRNHIK